jgi:hypothetical protein
MLIKGQTWEAFGTAVMRKSAWGVWTVKPNGAGRYIIVDPADRQWGDRTYQTKQGAMDECDRHLVEAAAMVSVLKNI